MIGLNLLDTHLGDRSSPYYCIETGKGSKECICIATAYFVTPLGYHEQVVVVSRVTQAGYITAAFDALILGILQTRS